LAIYRLDKFIYQLFFDDILNSMLENALKNMFPYKELSLSEGETLSINESFYFIQDGIVQGTFGNKVPVKFECAQNEIFGLRQLLDNNFQIKTLQIKKSTKLLSFHNEDFNKMLQGTDKNIVVFLKSLIQHGTF
tara:strand:+ start:2357 stop:2758 length:402 start_codon:yes stop_codon:yes gene_type:complete